MKYDFYLGHPFIHRHKIRDELQVPLQQLGYSVANPFYNENLTPRQDVARIEAGMIDKYDLSARNSDEIVNADLEAIQDSEAAIFYLPEPGIGTSMELFHTSHNLDNPAAVITRKYAGHPWIQVYGEFTRPTISSMIDRIIKDGMF